MSEGVVIVGGGQAGFQVAASLRAGGYGGGVRLIGAELHPPYQRPPLSKALLLGKMERQRLLFRQPAFYEAQGDRAAARRDGDRVDRAARTVTTAGGGRCRYETLVLSTGTRVRPLPVPGAELAGVVYSANPGRVGGSGPPDRARRSASW